MAITRVLEPVVKNVTKAIRYSKIVPSGVRHFGEMEISSQCLGEGVHSLCFYKTLPNGEKKFIEQCFVRPDSNEITRVTRVLVDGEEQERRVCERLIKEDGKTVGWQRYSDYYKPNENNGHYNVWVANHGSQEQMCKGILSRFVRAAGRSAWDTFGVVLPLDGSPAQWRRLYSASRFSVNA